MAEAGVIDELIVRLTLDAEEYERVERKVDKNADRTERKAKDRARTTDRRDKDQQKRLKDIAAGARLFATQVAAAATVVAGLGIAVGATLTNLLGFETGLRRQTVGTALSNRQMQAWGATARRLGADASAGADAIAALAKERQQFELTGTAPTMQALARMGVNVDKGRPIEEVLSQAQQIYRKAPEGQKQQYENTLSAQGVSPDLILMIKSETDVREAFAKSYSQASEENRKALDALSDALESMKAQAIAIASTLLTALQPAIEAGAAKLADFATQVASFANDLQAAGGGVEGFQAALDKNIPSLGHLFEGFRAEADLISAGGEILSATFKALGKTLDTVLGWLNTIRAPWGAKGLVDDLRDRTRAAVGAKPGLSVGQAVALKVDDFGRKLLGEARQMNLPALKTATPSNPNPNNLPRNIEDDAAGRPAAPARGAGAAAPDVVMTRLITDYGLNTQQAAAVVANWQRESGLNPAAVNPAGGGTGARGLAQWRGDRTKAFQTRYGVTPDRATLDQQVEFAMTDPYERALLDKSLRTGDTAAEMGRGVSQYYEAHGNVAEDMRRGRDAERLASAYGGNGGNTTAAPAAPSVTIQQMTVQANDAGSFVGGLQRLSGTQNYNTVQR